MKKQITTLLSILLVSIGSVKGQLYLSSIPNSGLGGSAQIALDSTGNIYVGTVRQFVDSQFVYRINPATNQRDTLAKLPNRVAGMEISNMDTVLYLTYASNLYKYILASKTLKSLNTGFEYPTVLRLRRKTNELYCIEVGGDNGRAAILAKYDAVTGVRTKVAGGLPGNSTQEVGYVNGIGNDVRFRFISPNGPFKNGGGLAFSPDEDTLYIGDALNRCIRKLHIATGEVSTFAGPLPDSVRVGFQDGFRFDARFNTINGLAVDKNGNLYVADNGPFNRDTTTGNRIRKISPAGMVKTLIGSGIGRGTGSSDNLDFTPGLNGKDAKIGNLNDIVFNKTLDTLYISQNQRILKAMKRKSSLRFNQLQDRMVGTGKYGIRTLSNSAVQPNIAALSFPANVAFSDDTVNVPSNAETGFVILRATQNEDRDSIYTTTVVDTFSVIPFVSNKILSKVKLLAYPNPVKINDMLQIAGENLSNGNLQISIADGLGRQVQHENITIQNQQLRHEIRMPKAAGLYWITLRNGSEILKASIVTE